MRTQFTYLPIRLQSLMSEVGSGIVIELLDRIDPDNLKHFLAMIGSYHKKDCIHVWWSHCLCMIEGLRMCCSVWKHRQRDAANLKLCPLFTNLNYNECMIYLYKKYLNQCICLAYLISDWCSTNSPWIPKFPFLFFFPPIVLLNPDFISLISQVSSSNHQFPLNISFQHFVRNFQPLIFLFSVI